MTHLKSWIAIVISLVMVALTVVQGLAVPGHTWTTTDYFVIVLAVLQAAGSHFTQNADDTGLDGRAKAVVAATIAVLIVAVQAVQPLLGQPLTTAGATVALLAVLNALGVYAAPNRAAAGVSAPPLEPADVQAAQDAAAAVEALPPADMAVAA